MFRNIARLMLLLVICQMASCSDAPEQVLPDGPLAELRLSAGTRGEGDVETLNQIRIYMGTGTGASATAAEGNFTKVNDSWTSSGTMVKAGVGYSIFGYTPITGISFTSTIAPAAGGYSYGAVMTLTDVPTVLKDDLRAVVGVYDVQPTTDTEIIAGTAEPAEIPRGSFAYEGKADDNYVCLLLAHLYAAVDIKALVSSEEYLALRHIRIKKVEVDCNSKTTLTLTMNSSSVVASNFLTVATPTAMTPQTYELFNDATGLVLTGTAQTDPLATVYMAPTTEALPFVIKTTYDVLSADESKVIREGQTAENKVSISLLRGQRKTLTLKVDPTYLYQLWESDPDNPSIKISIATP